MVHVRAAAALMVLFAASASEKLTSQPSVCVGESAPNPLATKFPDISTGNLNGTNMIIPIPLHVARGIMPKGLDILEDAYREWLPDFPKDMYPMMALGVHDHDVQAVGFHLPDFSRSGFEFPFVDLLGDGYSSFRYSRHMLITNGSLAANGSAGFGINVFPAAFEPTCNAYKANLDGFTTFKGVDVKCSSRFMKMRVQQDYTNVPYSLDFFRNITNQPSFATPEGCDNYQRIFDTPLTQPPFEPVPVRGTVESRLAPFHKKQRWTNVHGWRLSTAFTEPLQLSNCSDLKGFHVTGRVSLS